MFPHVRLGARTRIVAERCCWLSTQTSRAPEVIPAIAANTPTLTEWRRDFHMHPELGFEEFRTSALVASRLTEMGIKVTTGMAGTGVVGTLTGNGSCSNEISSIGLRSDMDALPMDEFNEFNHKSTVDGKFHGCGHDGHTTMLLGAAAYLASTRHFSGTVHFIFQPAEEGLGGGRVMVEEGLFEKFHCDQIFGMHNWPLLPAGKVGVRSGPLMAGADKFDIRIRGHGGHAAMPNQCVDPILIGSTIINSLQSIVSRCIDPLDSAVVSVTQFEAGSAYNVIPDSAHLKGTIRCFTPEVRETVLTKLEQLVESTAAAHGGEASVEVDVGFPPTINNVASAEMMASVVSEVFGRENVLRDPTPTMGAEDFSYMLQQRPGCYMFLGQADHSHGHDHGCMVHNPHYDFNDDVLPHGATVFAKLVEELMPADKAAITKHSKQ